MTVAHVSSAGKYSEELNTKDLRKEEKPYRIQKLNVIWNKARQRLSQEKLKLLDIELKIQDKDELTWKRLKVEGEDKDGLKEAELRKNLRGILNRYDLNQHFEDDSHLRNAKSTYNEAYDKRDENLIFKDKKLNKLWIKAERAGFSEEELKTLKEEFQHHQEKLEEYYEFMNKEPAKDEEMDNAIDPRPEKISKDTSTNHNKLLKEKHRDIKKNYEKLGRLAALGPEDKDFDVQKVKDLWELVLQSNFTQEELDSLKEELKHYEHRIRKLEHFQSQVDLADASNKWGENNVEDRKRLEEKVKHYSHKVNKMHSAIEGRILQRHTEL